MRSFLLAVVVLAGLCLVPSAFARTDTGSRVASEGCGAAYSPSCTINFTLVPSPSPGGPTANAPHIGGSVRYAVTESPVFSDGCSQIEVVGRVTGANSGYTGQSQSGQTIYAGYSGARAGIDTVTFSVDIAACNGWVYHTTLNGVADGQVQESVGWGMNLWDNGQCDSPSDTVFGGVAFRSAFQQQCVDDPVSGGMGAYESAVTDAVLPSPGMPFAFERSYTAGDTSSGPLGFGWRDNYDAKLWINTNVSPNTVTALMGTGQQILFTQQTDGSWLGPAWATATLTYASATGLYTLRQAGHVAWTFNGSNGFLTGISRNGQTLSVGQQFFGPSSVTTSNGRSVVFYYDANYRLYQMVMPGGRNVYYSYDAAGNLATVTDLRGGVTHYTYDTSHDLLTVVDPRGNTVVTNVYGDYGRLVSQTDALGKTHELRLEARALRSQLHRTLRPLDCDDDRSARTPMDAAVHRRRATRHGNRPTRKRSAHTARTRRRVIRSATPIRPATQSSTATTLATTRPGRRCRGRSAAAQPSPPATTLRPPRTGAETPARTPTTPAATRPSSPSRAGPRSVSPITARASSPASPTKTARQPAPATTPQATSQASPRRWGTRRATATTRAAGSPLSSIRAAT